MTTSQTAWARFLRRSETEAEHKLWLALRDRRLSGHKFVRQFPIGPFFADFACRASRLVVELDGSPHAGSQRDIERDRVLLDQGFAVLRFWNHEVMHSFPMVCETIFAAAQGRLELYDRYTVPSSALRAPSPRGGEGDAAIRSEPVPSPRRGEDARRTDEGQTVRSLLTSTP